jgi:hypothetical protein
VVAIANPLGALHRNRLRQLQFARSPLALLAFGALVGVLPLAPTAAARRPGLARSARGPAVSSSVQASLLEAVGPPKAVGPIVVFDTTACLKPLADMISSRITA